MQDDYI